MAARSSGDVGPRHVKTATCTLRMHTCKVVCERWVASPQDKGLHIVSTSLLDHQFALDRVMSRLESASVVQHLHKLWEGAEIVFVCGGGFFWNLGPRVLKPAFEIFTGIYWFILIWHFTEAEANRNLWFGQFGKNTSSC